MTHFRIPARYRLMAFLTGRVPEVIAAQAPVVVRRNEYGWSLNYHTFPVPPEARYQPRPILTAEWVEPAPTVNPPQVDSSPEPAPEPTDYRAFYAAIQYHETRRQLFGGRRAA